jgi:c-di-GMP-binding flagellar brake protein YcgR
MADDSHYDNETDLSIQDHVQADAVIAGRPVAFRAVLVKVCERELWLGLTSPDRRLEQLRLGRPMRLSVARQGTALVGSSEFLRAMGGSRSRVFAVRRPEALESVQRRSAARIEVGLPVRFRQIDPGTWQPRGRSSTGTTVNLSSGGLLLRTDATLAVGQDLDLMLPLSGGDRISTTDRVVRVGPASTPAEAESGRPANIEVAVRFTRITAIDKEWIVRFMLLTEHRRRESLLARPAAACSTQMPSGGAGLVS